MPPNSSSHEISIRRGILLPLLQLGLCGVAIAAQAQPGLPVPADKAPRQIVVAGEKFFSLGFDSLSAFNYKIVDAGTGASPDEIVQARKREQVPGWLYAYQNQRVVLTGYLLPLQVENGLSKKFIVMRDINTCCYGGVPNMNDYVVVTMKGDGVKAVQDIPMELIGVFHIEEKYDNGYVTSLFQMEGEKLLGPKK